MINYVLCKYCSSIDGNFRWLPKSVNSYSEIIERKIVLNNNTYQYSLNKNISYSLQYLEYLSKCFDELNLTSVLYTLNVKFFLITAASIIEAILYHEIKSNNLQNKSVWNFIKKMISNGNIEEKSIRLETSIFEECAEKEEDMTFDQMLSKIESKKLLGEDHNIYAKINILRKLRNKVHLQLSNSKDDNDYFNFDYRRLTLAKKTLLDILIYYFSLKKEDVENCFYFLKEE